MRISSAARQSIRNRRHTRDADQENPKTLSADANLFSFPLANLEPHNGQAGDLLEVAKIGRSHGVAEFERRYAYQKIGKRNADSAGLILAVDLSGAQCDGHGDR